MHKIYREIANFFSKKSYLLPSLYGRGLGVGLLAIAAMPAFAQRTTDKDRGLVAMKVNSGVYLSWRLLGSEYYDVTYNVYKDGTLIKSGLKTSNYSDTSGSATSTYTVSAVVRGQEQAQSKAASVWSTSYKEIKLKHEGIKSTLVPNDACCADVDGDGELEILMKFDNDSEIQQSYPKLGPKIDGKATGEYSIFEVLKQDGTRLWWVNCGPNMGDFQNNEQNIIAYDWDGDGKAEAVMRAADGTVIHCADGSTYTVGDATKNYRAATGGGTNWFLCQGAEYLVYMDGATGKPYQCITYPLARFEAGETSMASTWGKDDGGHRCSKFFFATTMALPMSTGTDATRLSLAQWSSTTTARDSPPQASDMVMPCIVATSTHTFTDRKSLPATRKRKATTIVMPQQAKYTSANCTLARTWDAQ